MTDNVITKYDKTQVTFNSCHSEIARVLKIFNILTPQIIWRLKIETRVTASPLLIAAAHSLTQMCRRGGGGAPAPTPFGGLCGGARPPRRVRVGRKEISPPSRTRGTRRRLRLPVRLLETSSPSRLSFPGSETFSRGCMNTYATTYRLIARLEALDRLRKTIIGAR